MFPFWTPSHSPTSAWAEAPHPLGLGARHSQNVLEVDSWINQHFPTQCNMLPMSAGDEGMEASMPCIF